MNIDELKEIINQCCIDLDIENCQGCDKRICKLQLNHYLISILPIEKENRYQILSNLSLLINYLLSMDNCYLAIEIVNFMKYFNKIDIDMIDIEFNVEFESIVQQISYKVLLSIHSYYNLSLFPFKYSWIPHGIKHLLLCPKIDDPKLYRILLEFYRCFADISDISLVLNILQITNKHQIMRELQAKLIHVL